MTVRRWSTALKSNEYKQAAGCLFNGKAYCCLGVLEREAGIDFLPVGEFNHGYRDVLDQSSMPHPDVAAQYDLDKPIETDDIDKIREAIRPFVEHPTFDYVTDISEEGENGEEGEGNTRMEALASLNDSGVPFEGIAAVLEKLGWDVKVKPFELPVPATA